MKIHRTYVFHSRDKSLNDRNSFCSISTPYLRSHSISGQATGPHANNSRDESAGKERFSTGLSIGLRRNLSLWMKVRENLSFTPFLPWLRVFLTSVSSTTDENEILQSD